MKQGIDAVGIDANPSSCFSTRVKTNWKLKGDILIELVDEVKLKLPIYLRRRATYRQDRTYRYLEDTGMIERGWISPKPLRKAIAIKTCIAELNTTSSYKDALMLALIAEVVAGASNVKFGPELYCGPVKLDADVLFGFAKRAEVMAKDLKLVSSLKAGKVRVIQGDSRDCNELLKSFSPRSFAAGICSPPYPAEHDYTRNARLELSFLEEVSDNETLRAIKRRMIRSSTKNIYKADCDAEYINGHPVISAIVEELKYKAQNSNNGFARLYPVVIQEYFGGMKRHLKSMSQLLAPRAKCAYVVGDQSAYFQVYVPTAEILSSLANEVGFQTIDIEHWRSRWSTTTSKQISENILILQKHN